MEEQTTTQPSSNNMAIIAVVLVVLIAAIAFFMMRQNNNNTNITIQDQTAPTAMVGNNETTTGEDTSESMMKEETDQSAMEKDGATAAVKEFTVNGSNFKFEPATMSVKKGDTVKVTFKNTGGLHDFVLDEFNARTQQIGDGKTEVVQFVADKAGTFEYYCSVGKHREMGMVGTLTVTE